MFLFIINSKKFLECPLVVTTMSYNQCQFIDLPALYSSLQGSGLPSYTKIYIVAGPASQLGLNKSSFVGIQDREQITDLMTFGRNKRITTICIHPGESKRGIKLNYDVMGLYYLKKIHH